MGHIFQANWRPYEFVNEIQLRIESLSSALAPGVSAARGTPSRAAQISGAGAFPEPTHSRIPSRHRVSSLSRASRAAIRHARSPSRGCLRDEAARYGPLRSARPTVGGSAMRARRMRQRRAHEWTRDGVDARRPARPIASRTLGVARLGARASGCISRAFHFRTVSTTKTRRPTLTRPRAPPDRPPTRQAQP